MPQLGQLEAEEVSVAAFNSVHSMALLRLFVHLFVRPLDSQTNGSLRQKFRDLGHI